MAYHISQPTVAVLPSKDMLLFWNDYTPYEVGKMSLQDESGVLTYQSSGATAILADMRVLCWARSHTLLPVGTTKFVPCVYQVGLGGSVIAPIYEVINPTVLSVSGTMIVMSFWTNFATKPTIYSASNIVRLNNSELDNTGEVPTIVWRALCVMIIELKRYYITGGDIATREGDTPASPVAVEDIVPIAQQPMIVQVYSDAAALDAAGVGSGGSLLRILGLHSDSPVSGVRMYSGNIYGNGSTAAATVTGVTVRIPGIGNDVVQPSYGSWTDTLFCGCIRTTATWIGATMTHTDDTVYETIGDLILR